MASGLPDLVDCVLLAKEATVLDRVYELGDLPRLKNVLAEPQGTLRASFAFTGLPSGRPGAEVSILAVPRLVCQRCLLGFDLEVAGRSAIEFAAADADGGVDSAREFVVTNNGSVSLRELAEEELLLALPIAPACTTPLDCGNAPSYAADDAAVGAVGGMRRPFGALQDLLKKT